MEIIIGIVLRVVGAGLVIILVALAALFVWVFTNKGYNYENLD